MTPRNYLSFSQYSLFKRSPESYRKLYILGERGFSSKYTEFGKKIALIREGKEKPEDEIIETVMTFLPQYPDREYEMIAKVKIPEIPGKVSLLGRFDGVNFKKHIIGDDKASKKWTQARADKDEQITFYSYLYYLNKKHIPKFQLNWIETEDNDGAVVATGNIKTFETKRTIKDFIRLQTSINIVWKGIVEMSKSEWGGVV